MDPEFLRLYRRYVSALKAYENALQKRREVRMRKEKKTDSTSEYRRPVGAPEDYKPPQTPPIKSGPVPKPALPKFYLGDILGWAKVEGYSIAPGESASTDSGFDVDASYDKIQLELYWNAKIHYMQCKKEFFDYAWRKPANRGVKPDMSYENNLSQARGYAKVAAFDQWWGFDEKAEANLRACYLEVERACYKVWENYRDNPGDPAVQRQLVDIAVDAQLSGLDESPIVLTIMNEIRNLLKSGK